MTTAIKRRRGTTSQHATFTGLEGEITVDTTKDTLVVHDGATAGGFALLREDLSNNTNVITTTNTKTLTNKTFGDNPTFSAGTANGVAYLNGSKVLTTGSALTFDGTTLVTGKLQINQTSPYTYTLERDSGDGYLNIKGAQDGNSAFRFQTSTGGNSTYITRYQIGPYGDSIWSVSGSEQMRLTSTGLGIGTSSPSAKLHIVGASADQIRLGSAATEYYRIGRNGDGFFDFYGSQTSYNGYRFGGIDGTKLTLDFSGNLGLGVTPSAWYSADKTIELGYAGNSIFGAAIANIFITANAIDTSGGWKYGGTGLAATYGISNGKHIWSTAPSGTAGNTISFTQAMTLDASGNLGIGTSSPSARLVVDSGSIGQVSLFNSTNVSGGYIAVQNSGTSCVLLGSASNLAGGTVTDAALRAQGNLLFTTNGGYERMRIDSSGNLLVGTTSTLTGNPVLSVKQSASAYLGTFQHAVNADYTLLRLQHAYAQSTQQATMLQFCDSVGNERGTIKTNGTTTTYNTSSDYRLKESIQPMQNALAVVAQLNPVTYTWKADGSDGQGFIAHELQAVVPDCVTGEKDAVDAEGKPVYQGIDTSFLVATLTKAIQEQQEQINQLKAELAALKGK